MAHKYFSDREQGSVEQSSEEISCDVWNGIVSIFENITMNNALSCNFPEECPDGQGISGCDRLQLENAVKAEIPKLQIPIRTCRKGSLYQEDDVVPEKYEILDFIEFLYKNITDPEPVGRYHDFHSHYHYRFSDDGKEARQYRERINSIFARNGIVFFLDKDGSIKRSVPESFKKIISDIRFSTSDRRLNELLEISYSKFILPKLESRAESLEKIWDAFERIKTYYDENKKKSASTLVSVLSQGNTLFQKHIDAEFHALTCISSD